MKAETRLKNIKSIVDSYEAEFNESAESYLQGKISGDQRNANQAMAAEKAIRMIGRMLPESQPND